MILNDDELVSFTDEFEPNQTYTGILLKISHGIIAETRTSYASVLILPDVHLTGSLSPVKMPLDYDYATKLRIPSSSVITFEVSMNGFIDQVKQQVVNIKLVKPFNSGKFNPLFEHDKSTVNIVPNTVGHGFSTYGIYLTSSHGVIEGKFWANTIIIPPLVRTNGVISPIKYGFTQESVAKIFDAFPIPSLIHYYHGISSGLKKQRPTLSAPQFIRAISQDEILHLF